MFHAAVLGMQFVNVCSIGNEMTKNLSCTIRRSEPGETRCQFGTQHTNDRTVCGSLTAEAAEIYNIYASGLETYAGEQLLKFFLNLNQEGRPEGSWNAFLQTLESRNAQVWIEFMQAA